MNRLRIRENKCYSKTLLFHIRLITFNNTASVLKIYSVNYITVNFNHFVTEMANFSLVILKILQ